MLTITELKALIENDIAEIRAMLIGGQPISTSRIHDLQAHMSTVKDEIIKVQAQLIKELECQLNGAHNAIINRF